VAAFAASAAPVVVAALAHARGRAVRLRIGRLHFDVVIACAAAVSGAAVGPTLR
jgi:hypothetical protein